MLAEESNPPSFLTVFALLKLGTDGGEEGLKVGIQILRGDAEVPVQKEEELFLHQVHFCYGKAEAFVATNCRIAGPMLVLGRGIIEVLGCEDKRRKEDPVNGATHAFCYWGEPRLQTRKVDQGRHEGWHLNVGAVDEGLDKGLKGWKGGLERCSFRTVHGRR